MTLPSFATARDEILALFKVAWDANTPAVNGGLTPRVEWDAVDSKTARPVSAAWARITVEHTLAEQSTFGDAGARRFTRFGFVTVQIFQPQNTAGGFTLGEQLAVIARNAFEGVGTASGVWFRNAVISEAGSDAIWSRLNVRAEFQYDEGR